MSEIWAVIYGIIQGVTEFLPVSSSGHLALLPFFFEFEDPGVVFDLCMHLGTAMAVILYFWKDLLKLIINPLKFDQIKKNYYLQNFVVATLASVVMILLIKDIAFEFGRDSRFIAFNLIFFGILMMISDRVGSSKFDPFFKNHILISTLIGVAQSIAVFPGVSRSGITLTASRFMHIGRVQASRFSFLLSLPIILASIAYKAPQIITGEATSASISLIIIGILVSFITGLLTIHFFLKLMAQIGLFTFGLYRIALGIAILLV